ncbi:MAG: choice-of-anchor Q domain-containing protein [Tepidisphaerales bacterium]
MDSGSTATVSGLTVDGGAGGGITNHGNMTVTGSFVTGNTGNGGIINFGALTLKQSTVNDNSTIGSGGGIESLSGGSLTVSNSAIVNNTAVVSGGGIYDASTTSTITGTTISGNSASGQGALGGGLFLVGSSPTLINCVIAGNSAAFGAALFGDLVSKPILINCTVANNVVTGAGTGGTIYSDATSVATLTNCIVWDDLPSNGAEIRSFASAPSVVNYSDVAGTYANGAYPGTQNINADPMFAGNLSLAALSLQGDSPCINAGNNQILATYNITTDIDGNPRILPHGGTVDMGAYEYSGPVNLVLIQGPPQGGVTLPSTLTVVVSPEQNGVVIKDGSTVTLKIYKSSSLLETLPSVVDSNGQATFPNISFSGSGFGPGAYSCTASDGTDTSLSVNFAVNAPGLPKLFFASPFPSIVMAGQSTISVTVDITDSAGNPLSVNDPLVLLFNGSTYTVTAQSGVATFNLVTPPPSGTPYPVEADDLNYVSGAVAVTSFITVNPAVQSNVLTFGGLSPNQPQMAGTPITGITVTVMNNGAPVGNDPVTLSLFSGPSGATLTGNPNATTNASGVATFGGITLSPAGIYTLQGEDSTGVTTDITFTVTTPAVTTLVFPSPIPTFTLAPNVPLPPFQVWVEQNGTLLTSDNSQIEITLAIPSAAPYFDASALDGQVVNGIATFSYFFLGWARPTTLRASDVTNPSDIPAISNSFIVNPGPTVYFSVSAPNTTAGSSTTVTVDAQDGIRNFNPGYTGDVTLTITDSQGNVVATPTVTAAGGIATFSTIALDKAGVYGLSASGTGAGVVGGTGILTVTAAAPSQLGFDQQPGTAAANFPFAPPVSVAVEDRFGNVVTSDNSTNVSLSLAGGPAGAGLNGATIVQDINGVATFSTANINQPGTAYMLGASDDAGDTVATSNSFNILAPATIYVDQHAVQGNNGQDWPDAYTNLQSALAVAVPGDTIDVAQGDYLPGGDPMATFQLIEGITLQGGFATGGASGPNPAAYPTLLDGVGNNFSSYHVVTAIGGNVPTVLQGFTITGGKADGTGDAHSGLGGGMIVDGGSLAVSNCIFTANSAAFGAGIYAFAGASLTLSGVTILGNSGTNNGGGVAIVGSAIADIINSTLSGNSAPIGGGTYEDATSTLTLRNCTLYGNTGNDGGAIDSEGNLIVINSTLNGNTASAGGGIDTLGTLIVTDSTISGNSAVSGGGLYSIGGGTLDGTIIVGNTGSLGTADDLEGNPLAGSYDLIGVDNTGSFSNGVDNNIVGVTPAQLLFAPLASNGGPTQTMALLPGSPAIGASSIFNGPDTLPITLDQRGVLRPAGAPDIGACQLVVYPPLVITANGINGAYIYIESDGTGNLDWWVRNSAFASNPLGSITPDGTAVIANVLGGVQVTGSSGVDLLTVDFSNGSPIPSGGIAYDGVADGGTAGDSLALIGNGADSGTYTPSGSTPGSGTVTIGGGSITFSNLAPVIASSFATFSLVTPNGSDNLTIDSPTPGQSQVTGTSGGVAIEPLSFFNITNLILDTASNDVPGSADDTITIAPAGVGAAGLGVLGLNVGGGNNSLIVNGGNTPINTSLGVGGANLALTLNNTAIVSLPSSQQLAGITLNDSARLNLAGGGSTVVQTGRLLMSPNAVLDLGSSSLVLAYAGASPYAGLNNLVHNGALLGTGILTSIGTAALPATVGLVDNNMIHQTTWGGTTISDGVNFSQMILKGTYAGDTNLDGKVDQSDYLNVIANMGRVGATYFEGDLNHDGVVTMDDLALVAANLGAGAAFAAGPQLFANPATSASPLIAKPAAKLAAKKPVAKKPTPKPLHKAEVKHNPAHGVAKKR